MRAAAGMLQLLMIVASAALASARVCIRDEEQLLFSQSEFTAMATVTGIGAALGSPHRAVQSLCRGMRGWKFSHGPPGALPLHHPAGPSPPPAPRAAPLLAGASTSILGSGFIIFSYFYFPQLRTMAYKLIVYLSVADLCSSFAYVLGAVTQTQVDCKDGWCYFTAIVSQYFDVATFCWFEAGPTLAAPAPSLTGRPLRTSCIAFNIYQVLARNVGRAVESYERKYHMLCWGLPAVLATLGAAFQVYGSAGNWCWIQRQYPAARFFLYFFPFVTSFAFNATVFARTVHAMKDSGQDTTVAFRLRLYLVVFMVCKVFSLINRVQNFVDKDNPVFILFLLHSLFAPIQVCGIACAQWFPCTLHPAPVLTPRARRVSATPSCMG